MRLALSEAVLAQTFGDVPIGAVVVGPGGEIVSAAGNEREQSGDPTAHAEVLALRRASEVLGVDMPTNSGLPKWNLSGCTLVVTLEPCTMCAGAAVLSRVDRLVFGAFDEKAGAVASLWDVVRDPRLNHRVEVVSGVLADECADLLRQFFAARRGG